MGKSRVIVNLIDADGCTFNFSYNQRILHCMKHYGYIIREYAAKPQLSMADQELIDFYMRKKAYRELKQLRISEGAYKSLLADCDKEINIDGSGSPRSEKRKQRNDYIYQFIILMEKVCPTLLRHIYRLSNKHLIGYIKDQSEITDKIIMMLGSNRQSFAHDEHNCKDKGTSSIYEELNELTNHLSSILPGKEVLLDKFILADLYDGGDDAGNNFQKILNGMLSKAINIFDDSKINIIYACCHHIAKQHGGVEIDINMWDDKSTILNAIRDFFKKHPYLLPKGLRLKLHRYDGKLKSTEIVIGTGVIDYNYEKNTVLMASMCQRNPLNDNIVNIPESLDVDAFMRKRMTGWEMVLYGGEQTFFKRKEPQENKQIQEPLAQQIGNW